jgi:flagellar biosynthesis protein FlhA
MIKQSAWFKNSSELVMIAFATGILLILFIPIPASLLDLLLITNFSWALTILLLTFYTDKPLSFSTFPALLLISTLFRLSLNVSATRLILADGDAGRVIGAIGQYVIHDNYVMGLVVFLILIIVQYVVVTNGAQRVAEVAARFTLDSMPGKQMSIDADLNMGIISQADAKTRRAQIEKEANFYGAMDGASKFVKGDAIAGILIILVDIIGGFAIGMAQKGLSITDSIHTYTLLTVGDGLVTQIPALTISMATGIIVTRAATDAHLGREVAKQVSAYPNSLLMVCVSLLGLLFLKGIPVIPVMILLILFILSYFVANRTQQLETEEQHDNNKESLYEKIRIHPIEITLNHILFDELKQQEKELFHRLEQLRERIAFDLGFVIPEVKLSVDKTLTYPSYVIHIQGNAQTVKKEDTHQIMALTSNSVPTPPNTLQTTTDKEHQTSPSFNFLNTLSLDLAQVIYLNLSNLMTRTQTEALLNQPNVNTLRDELIPTLLPFGHVQRILQNLLQEHVSIRFLSIILETLLEFSKSSQDINQLTEQVRGRLSGFIFKSLMTKNDPYLSILTINPILEQKLTQGLNQHYLALDPAITDQFIQSLSVLVKKMKDAGKKPVLLCSQAIRRHIYDLTHRLLPQLAVISMTEIPVTIQLALFDVVS